MCSKSSCVITKSPDLSLYWGHGVTDSHAEIIEMAGLRNVYDSVNQYELHPKNEVAEPWSTNINDWSIIRDKIVFKEQLEEDLHRIQQHIKKVFPTKEAWVEYPIEENYILNCTNYAVVDFLERMKRIKPARKVTTKDKQTILDAVNSYLQEVYHETREERLNVKVTLVNSKRSRLRDLNGAEDSLISKNNNMKHFKESNDRKLHERLWSMIERKMYQTVPNDFVSSRYMYRVLDSFGMAWLNIPGTFQPAQHLFPLMEQGIYIYEIYEHANKVYSVTVL